MQFSVNKTALKIFGLQIVFTAATAAIYYFLRGRLGMRVSSSTLPVVLGTLLGAMGYALSYEQKIPNVLGAYTHPICRRMVVLHTTAQFFLLILVAEAFGRLPHSLRGLWRVFHSKRGLSLFLLVLVLSVVISYLGTWSGLRSAIKSVARRNAGKLP